MYSYIFDIGGVLIKYDHEAAIKHLAGSGEYNIEAIRTLFMEDLLYLTQTGRIAMADFYETHVKRAMPGITLEGLIEKYIEYFEVNPEGFELMLELKNRGRKVYILSNLAEYHKVALEHKIPGFFEHSILNFLSYDMGYYKPEAEIYQDVIRKTGERPENLVFFDDLPQNIEGAKKAGMKGMVFSNDRILEIREFISRLEAEEKG